MNPEQEHSAWEETVTVRLRREIYQGEMCMGSTFATLGDLRCAAEAAGYLLRTPEEIRKMCDNETTVLVEANNRQRTQLHKQAKDLECFEEKSKELERKLAVKDELYKAAEEELRELRKKMDIVRTNESEMRRAQMDLQDQEKVQEQLRADKKALQQALMQANRHGGVLSRESLAWKARAYEAEKKLAEHTERTKECVKACDRCEGAGTEQDSRDGRVPCLNCFGSGKIPA
jgi:chromosome segregation ATPase